MGPIVSATVLCAWSHPGRCRSDASFASLAGVAHPASSGLTARYGLNRCGDRQLSRALHVIALFRLRHDPAIRAYAEGTAPTRLVTRPAASGVSSNADSRSWPSGTSGAPGSMRGEGSEG